METSGFREYSSVPAILTNQYWQTISDDWRRGPRDRAHVTPNTAGNRPMAEAAYKPFWARQTTVSVTDNLPDGPIADVLRYVPSSVALDLTEHQIAVLNEALARRRQQKRHSIDYRGTLNWLGRRYYVSLFAGPEVRTTAHESWFSPRRLIREGLGLASIGAGSVVATGLFIVGLYLVKSLAGINLLDGPSFMHEFFFD